MKLRTKLEYRCTKNNEFDYGVCDWVVKYNRSFDMVVTADSKEECKKTMESFENYMREYGVQECFESNLEPELNKKNQWVGLVEIYVDNNSVADDKEIITGFYKQWKELLKKAPIAEKKSEDELLFTIATLSSGTVANLMREAGMVSEDEIVTYSKIDKITGQWLEFVQKEKISSKNWQDSWNIFKESFNKPKEKKKNVKKIGGAIYIHRSNVEALDKEQFDLLWSRWKQLAESEYSEKFNSYEVIKIKDDSVSFIEVEGWDILREPRVGNSYCVKSDGSVKLTKKRGLIYHHKWMFVADDYDGFDVEEEKAWSKKWQSVVPKGLSSKLGYEKRWNEFLDEYGLDI